MTVDTASTVEPREPLASSRSSIWLLAAARIGVALMWIDNASWKRPPEFGRGEEPRMLYAWTLTGVEHEVFAPYAWLLDNVVLPNFTFFGWAVLIVEASLGAFLFIGLLTRAWALIGMAQTAVIALSTLNAPHEWYWAYLLMFLVHLMLFATAAGRYGGLDGVLRPIWRQAGRLTPLLEKAS
ncbi:TQO small subunit DoxD [Actinobacteria bacterium YIM 96077]|uniref:TQO small subunit DoxD n=1 Tax=Phytoactinopolyspora halophila TaxID=1981511 RepID=A0A329QP37_9ACTN|nr:TQO small subunit DoxD [Phytoactinopolyspora halophila]AYY14521.1 TQO small subunit DoxD [Actinobacteria bacterium YIM 96077]RAW14100.1 TQO small subunit DoxD [Phytoactinopolyspora halophila]